MTEHHIIMEELTPMIHFYTPENVRKQEVQIGGIEIKLA